MKYSKRRTKKRHTILLILGIIVFFILIYQVISMMHEYKLSYEGLGNTTTLENNTYDMSVMTKKNGHLYYDDGTYETKLGVDVSTYQGEIDWEKVKSAGVDVAIIRLGYRGSTDGKTYLDDRFEENLTRAKAAGLQVGVYFFSQAQSTKEAISEAKFVLETLSGKDIHLPVTFDMEAIGENDRVSDMSVEERTEIADAFCSIIDKNGYKAMIYGNMNWLYNYFDLEYLTKYDTWLAHYQWSTDYPYKFSYWQYTNMGTIAGIKGHVDLNLVFVKKQN